MENLVVDVGLGVFSDIADPCEPIPETDGAGLFLALWRFRNAAILFGDMADGCSPEVALTMCTSASLKVEYYGDDDDDDDFDIHVHSRLGKLELHLDVPTLERCLE
mmetsp:Transcript_139720/g.445874  ORF Transcript_139720/g.445874 Transcript_139720/m.445874 type:complete len:106 (-) Transcript_139720:100-417(-)